MGILCGGCELAARGILYGPVNWPHSETVGSKSIFTIGTALPQGKKYGILLRCGLQGIV